LIDLDSPYAPTQLGGGASVTLAEVVTVGADALVDLTTYESAALLVGGGVEYLSAGRIPLRLGYSFDSGRRVHSVTGGLGYLDQKVGIELSLRQAVHGDDGTLLMASFRYFVQ